MKTKSLMIVLLSIFVSLGIVAAPSVGATPPGLQGKAMPHGLSKQNKTPAGWSKGKKSGWYKHKRHHYHHQHKVHHHNDDVM